MFCALTKVAFLASVVSAGSVASAGVTINSQHGTDDTSIGGIIVGTAVKTIGTTFGPKSAETGFIVGYDIGSQGEKELIALRINAGTDWTKDRKKITAFAKGKSKSIERKSKDLSRALRRKVRDLGNRYGF